MQSSLIDMEMISSHYNIMMDEETYEPLDEEMVRQAIGGILPDDILDSMHSLTLANQNLPEEDIDIFIPIEVWSVAPYHTIKESNKSIILKDTEFPHPSEECVTIDLNLPCQHTYHMPRWSLWAQIDYMYMHKRNYLKESWKTCQG